MDTKMLRYFAAKGHKLI